MRKLAASLERFGFVLPILIDAGPGRRGLGAGSRGPATGTRRGASGRPDRPLGSRATDAAAALNRIAEDCAWDHEALILEFSEILELAPDIGLEVSGFEMGEIDALLDGAASIRKTSSRRSTGGRAGDSRWVTFGFLASIASSAATP